METIPNRRALLQGAVSFALASSLGAIPTLSHADSICRVCRLSRIHPARLAAGLVFDTVRSMVIQDASRSMISSLFSARGIRYAPSSQPINEYHKGALAYAGESDYDLYRETRIQSILQNSQQRNRLEEVKSFLDQNEIRIKSAYTTVSYAIDDRTSLDDILSIEYFTNIENNEFLESLVMISSSSAVNEWMIS